jgi:signal transduction histidine kinase
MSTTAAAPTGVAEHLAAAHGGPTLLDRPPGSSHIVQFYDGDDFLAGVVTRFLAAGLEGGEPAVVVATPEHRQLFRAGLERRGFDVDGALASGRLTMLDAQETLARFMVDGMPDAACFRAEVGAVVADLCAGPAATCRAYGEMVDVLWRQGRHGAAIRLEELWNELGRAHTFSLLCAYRMGNFAGAADGRPLAAVCGTHSHVIPMEGYSAIDGEDARLREVASLQQRARALESEIEQRRQVEQALRRALAQRDEFLAVAGHELRTPLTAIRLQVDSLRAVTRNSGDSRVRERLGKTADNINRLSRLIDQLLDVSTISAGRFELNLEDIDLVGLVGDVVERMTDQLARYRCPVRVEAAGPVVGHWDPHRIQQVIANLLSNGVKYGPGKAIEVTVSADDRRARLVVRDHGIGISPEDQARIFERFERAVPIANYGGFGLGLWLVKQIVDAHGGTISLESELRAGATFTVELPLFTPAPPPIAA